MASHVLDEDVEATLATLVDATTRMNGLQQWRTITWAHMGCGVRDVDVIDRLLPAARQRGLADEAWLPGASLWSRLSYAHGTVTMGSAMRLMPCHIEEILELARMLGGSIEETGRLRGKIIAVDPVDGVDDVDLEAP